MMNPQLYDRLPPSPLPYSMCSREECEERQRMGEVSIFEQIDENDEPTTTSTSSNAGPPRHGFSKQKQQPQQRRARRLDPCRAVAKYRRSAAGTEQKYPTRTLEQLHQSVDYLLLVILAQQQVPPPSSRSADEQVNTLLNTVSFVEDRVRAIQAELVMTQQASKLLQLKLIRSHTLIGYLLIHVPESKYSHKFGRTALTTALSNYWNHEKESISAQKNNDDGNTDDEVLAYNTLLAVCHYCQQQSSGAASVSDVNCSLSSVSVLYRQYIVESRRKRLPLFQWSLRLMTQVCLGFAHNALKMLSPATTTTVTTSSNNNGDVSLRQTANHSQFMTLARCCMAPAISVLRYQALAAYNVSFAKAEAVPASDVARLLCIVVAPTTSNGSSEAKAALEFGRSVGLEVKDDCLVFKSTTLPDTPPVPLFATARNDHEDAFVFGKTTRELCCWRVDSDGIRIPSPKKIQSLLLLRQSGHPDDSPGTHAAATTATKGPRSTTPAKKAVFGKSLIDELRRDEVGADYFQQSDSSDEDGGDGGDGGD